GFGDLGYFEFREPRQAMAGIVIGAPHGRTEPDSLDYADWISKKTGTGLVAAFGFKQNRLAVARPIVRSIVYGGLLDSPRRGGTIYPEFKNLLQKAAGGHLKFYVGLRFFPVGSHAARIETVASGLSFEELRILKSAYIEIRDHVLRDSSIAEVPMVIDPLDPISWRIATVKHHGVLMRAERGISLRLPSILSTAEMKRAYRNILTRWVSRIIEIESDPPASLPRLQVKVMAQGRLERIPARNQRAGMVVGAPHGTFDEYTAEMVKQICIRTGLPAVVAKGFSPTEGDGWRINVNRPTERRYPSGEIEMETERARRVYSSFKQLVLAAAQGPLLLYVDIHQNGREPNIQVATLGVSKQQAQVVKNEYRKIRDRILRDKPDLEAVDLLIEPIDSVEIGAWAAKTNGILRVSRMSLHIELPAYRVLQSSRSRGAYTEILAALLDRIAASHDPVQPPVFRADNRLSAPFSLHLGNEIAEDQTSN
ncbi:MAG TPA: hypothetical protein VE131_12710, partial [Terriglobales bacterium]|nr:hypothetical protein [Terriglobales bacterium]